MKIAVISDLNFAGSGYFNIITKLCDGLSKLGHEIFVAGIGYKGEEHYWDFSIIPAKDMNEMLGIVQNLYNLWKFDVLLVALDIYIQEQILKSMEKKPFKYFGIFPVESDPLCMSWAGILTQMDRQFVISKFGTEECKKAGLLNAIYLPVGIDLDAWRPPTPDEKKTIRKALGIGEDEFIVLTVADNQERKNLSAALEAFAKFSKKHGNTRYFLQTRKFNLVGWRMDDYFLQLGIVDKVVTFERGMNQPDLWKLYAAADCFMLASKAEGLSVSLLEALAVGLPCIGTNCTGMKELLGDGRGLLVDYEYVHVDPFGNGHRYWINKKKLEKALMDVATIEFVPNYESIQNLLAEHTWKSSIYTIEKELNNVQTS